MPDQRLRRLYYRQYLHRQIGEWGAKAERFIRDARWLQITIICGSLTTTTLAGAGLGIDALRWVTALSSLIVGVAAGVNGYYRPATRGAYYHKLAQSLANESTQYQQAIGIYGKLPPDEALALFVERAEDIRLSMPEPFEGQVKDEAPDGAVAAGSKRPSALVSSAEVESLSAAEAVPRSLPLTD